MDLSPVVFGLRNGLKTLYFKESPIVPDRKGETMAEKEHWCITASDVFASMDEADRKRIAGMVSHIPLRKSEAVFTPGERAETLFILDRGKVKISRLTEEGRELTLDILKPGDLFGEMAIARGGNRRSTNAEALEDSVVCAISRRDFEKLAASNPRLSFAVTRWIGGRLNRIESRFENLIFKNVRTRLMTVLRELSGPYGERVPQGRKLNLNLSHQEIANLVGTTRETATLEINNLRREGRLLGEGRTLILPPPDPETGL